VLLVEKELENKQIYTVALLFFALDYINESDYDFERCKQFFDMHISEIQKQEYWKSGKHLGDCTHHATTCFRCLVEEYYDRAIAHFKEQELEISVPNAIRSL